MFWTRFYLYAALYKMHFRIPNTFNWFRPGLEIKLACEEANNVGAKIHFMGPELDQVTWMRLFHETRMNGIHYLWKRFSMWSNHFWELER